MANTYNSKNYFAHGGGELGVCHPCHAALDDGVADAQHLRQFCLYHNILFLLYQRSSTAP